MEDKKMIPVRNKDGEKIGAVYCPTDAAALKRYVEGVGRYKKAVALLICIDIAPDGTAHNRGGRRILSTAENKIYALFDEIIGYEGASKAFFSEVRPFAKVKGRFYCDQCLELVKQCINSQIGGK